MQKLRKNGGIKLIHTKVKSETPKVEWLIRLITDKNLKVNLSIFRQLIGTQKGMLKGDEVIFADHSFMKHTLKIRSKFYKEALLGISRLQIGKHIPDLEKEPLFYNPVFTTATDDDIEEKTIKPFVGNSLLSQIKTYGDLLCLEEH